MLLDRDLLIVAIKALVLAFKAAADVYGKGSEYEETLAGEEDHGEQAMAADLNPP